MNKVGYILILLQLLLSANIRFEKENRMVFNGTFRPDKIKIISKVPLSFLDSIPDDTLSVYYSYVNLPVAFSRNFHTSVCMDTMCRLVDIALFWDVTGKYLGFSLPQGEELTKKKHTPFEEKDYARLDEILGDSTSLLGFYTLSDIHPVRQSVAQADGTTGATLPDLSPWIIKDAAYTSYTLWHLAYGATRDSLLVYIKQHLLSNQLLFSILQDKNPFSEIRGLQWIGASNQDPGQFIEPALTILHNGNFLASRQALKFLKGCHIDKDRLQKEVIQLLDNQDFRIKNLALEYIRESDKLSQSVGRELLSRLKSDNYYLVNVILTILATRFEADHSDQLNLSVLLASKNINISNRIYYFLLSLPDKSSDIARKLNQYRRKML